MSELLKALIIEDDENDFILLVREFKRGGLRISPLRITSAEEMEQALRESRWDLIVSDYSLPGFDAPSALKIAKERKFDGPFIVVSGQIGEEMAVRAMREGAHDYLMKDRLDRLCPAVERELRETAARRESRAQELALRESERRFRDLVENIREVFWIASADGSELLYVSPVCRDICGKSQEQILADPNEWVESIDPADRAAAVEARNRLMQEEAYDTEYRLLRPDQTVRWVHDRGWRITVDDGRVSHLAGLIEDVTDRHEAEEALRRAQKLEALGRLAGGVAHDFNNLLTTIIGYSELISASLEDDHELKPDIDAIFQAGEKAASLTRQLLTFSRTQVVQTRVINLNEIVEGIVPMLKRLLGEDVTLAVSRDPELANVNADASQLEQVLMNLAVNGRDAMPEGGSLSIETSMSSGSHQNEPDRAKHWVVLNVTDTGTGMSPEVLDRIFDPFFTTKEPDKGTGLGLATVHGIVRQHAGEILVKSSPGCGSCFQILIPATGASMPEPGSGDQSGEVSGTERILVVDDEASVCRLVRESLEPLGYRVTTSTNAAEAVQLIEKGDQSFDLLLTDLIMPGINGKDLADRVRQKMPSARIVFMSGYPGELLSQLGLEGSRQMLLAKPLLPSRLARSIREALDS